MPDSFTLFQRDKRVSKKKTSSLIYYVQYINPQTGKRLSAKSTGQRTKSAAYTWAKAHEDIVIAKKTSSTKNPLETLLSTYYAENSIYMKKSESIDGPISVSHRKHCNQRLIKYCVPFFKESGVTTIQEVTRGMVTELRDSLRIGDYIEDGKPLAPKTVNDIISILKVIWKALLDNGTIKENPLSGIKQIRNPDPMKRGVFPTASFQGVFLCDWNSEFYYMLCLLGATTGLRNSEIEALTPESIITIGNTDFLDIKFAHETNHPTKTKAGIRKIPLHPFVSTKLKNYITMRKIPNGGYIFRGESDKKIYWREYNKAVAHIAALMGFDKNYLEENHISFYSFRHFYNSRLLDEGINKYKVDILMGHSIGKDMTANYYSPTDQSFSDVIDVIGKLFVANP